MPYPCSWFSRNFNTDLTLFVYVRPMGAVFNIEYSKTNRKANRRSRQRERTRDKKSNNNSNRISNAGNDTSTHIQKVKKKRNSIGIIRVQFTVIANCFLVWQYLLFTNTDSVSVYLPFFLLLCSFCVLYFFCVGIRPAKFLRYAIWNLWVWTICLRIFNLIQQFLRAFSSQPDHTHHMQSYTTFGFTITTPIKFNGILTRKQVPKRLVLCINKHQFSVATLQKYLIHFLNYLFFFVCFFLFTFLQFLFPIKYFCCCINE